MVQTITAALVVTLAPTAMVALVATTSVALTATEALVVGVLDRTAMARPVRTPSVLVARLALALA